MKRYWPLVLGRGFWDYLYFGDIILLCMFTLTCKHGNCPFMCVLVAVGWYLTVRRTMRGTEIGEWFSLLTLLEHDRMMSATPYRGWMLDSPGFNSCSSYIMSPLANIWMLSHLLARLVIWLRLQRFTQVKCVREQNDNFVISCLITGANMMGVIWLNPPAFQVGNESCVWIFSEGFPGAGHLSNAFLWGK